MTNHEKRLVFYIVFWVTMLVQFAMVMLKATGVIQFHWLLVFIPLLFSCVSSVLFLILFFIYDSIFMFGHDNDDFEK